MSDSEPSVDAEKAQSQPETDSSTQKDGSDSRDATEKDGVLQRFIEARANWGSRAACFMIILVLGAILIALARNLPVLKNLAEPGYARGIITFIITIATIGLAFVLVFQAFQKGRRERITSAEHVKCLPV